MLPWIFAHGSFESFSVIDPCSGLVGLEVKNKKNTLMRHVLLQLMQLTWCLRLSLRSQIKSHQVLAF